MGRYTMGRYTLGHYKAGPRVSRDAVKAGSPAGPSGPRGATAIVRSKFTRLHSDAVQTRDCTAPRFHNVVCEPSKGLTAHPTTPMRSARAHLARAMPRREWLQPNGRLARVGNDVIDFRDHDDHFAQSPYTSGNLVNERQHGLDRRGHQIHNDFEKGRHGKLSTVAHWTPVLVRRAGEMERTRARLRTGPNQPRRRTDAFDDRGYR